MNVKIKLYLCDVYNTLIPIIMQKYLSIVLLLLSSGFVVAENVGQSTEVAVDTLSSSGVDSISGIFANELAQLVEQRNEALNVSSKGGVADAYSLRLSLSPTFYSSSVLQQFSADGTAGSTDPHLMRMYMLNDAFAKMYVNKPEIVKQTDDEVMQAGTLRSDVQTTLTTDTKLSDKVVAVDLGTDMDEHVEIVMRKPNFWKFSGSGSVHFTQNYFSENWYQGGENNYSFLGLLTLSANYDNKKNMQWENSLETRLGFQTTGDSEQYHSFKPTENLLRLTTKFGYKAYKSLFYTTQVQAYTQIVPQYEANSDKLISNFLSPLNLTVSVGLDYKFETKNQKFKGNVYLAPCAYNMKYVSRLELATRYGIDEDSHAFHNFGPSVTVNASWQIIKNISWNTRIFWISDLAYTNIEWENTFDFTINKYLTAKLFVYPKFDDSSSKSATEEQNYFMLKEMLSLGLTYSW